ncbi:uncharacterized protein LOC116247914 [Nymphaea colorata]|nr:uncharacterized protein LOC116247914 [Nymphaea colorata]
MKRKNPSGGVDRKGSGPVDLDRAPGHAIGLRPTSPATNLIPRNSVKLVEVETLEKKTVGEPTAPMGRTDRDDQLKMFRKCTDNHNYGNESNFSRTKCYKRRCSRQMMTTNMKFDQAGGHVLVQKLADFQEPCNDSFSFRMIKRKGSHVTPPHAEADKVREPKEKVWGQFSERLLKKVDAVAFPHRMMGEQCIHSSFRDRTTGNFEMNVEDQQPVIDTRWLSSRNVDFNGAESAACSVGSCSTSKPCNSLRQQCKTYRSKDIDGCFDDAQSSCALGYGKECPSATKEELAAKIHKLELHAYRSTMEALYASGPLSWEQEALMTNLRLNLHISNEEHLLELRQLVSS